MLAGVGASASLYAAYGGAAHSNQYNSDGYADCGSEGNVCR